MNLQNPVASQEAIKSARLPDAQTVTSIKHWSDRLFSFRVTRPQSLRFRSGEFVMIGLMGDNDRPLMRAYSIASPSWDDELEFYSIKVQDGPLTSRLQHIQVGDSVIIRPKPVGTLVREWAKLGGHTAIARCETFSRPSKTAARVTATQ